MIKEQDLIDAIAECQGTKNPNANTCRNLAAFYTILDHIREKEQPEPMMRPVVKSSFEYKGESEFASIIKDMNADDVMAVMDELMTTLEVINPRLYAGVMRKLTEY